MEWGAGTGVLDRLQEMQGRVEEAGWLWSAEACNVGAVAGQMWRGWRQELEGRVSEEAAGRGL